MYIQIYVCFILLSAKYICFVDIPEKKDETMTVGEPRKTKRTEVKGQACFGPMQNKRVRSLQPMASTMIYRFPRVYGHMTSGRQWEARCLACFSFFGQIKKLFSQCMSSARPPPPFFSSLTPRYASFAAGLIHSMICDRVNDITARRFAFQQPRHVLPAFFLSSSIGNTPIPRLS